MTTFSDLLVKIAQNKPLTPSELADLGRFGNETQQRNSFVGGHTTAAGTLSVPTPFFPIYSEVLQADTASHTVKVPLGYKHLMILSSGRCTSSSTVAQSLRAQINGDTGSNYAYAICYLDTTTFTPTGSGSAAYDYLTVGSLAGGTTDAGRAGASFCFIPHYLNSSMYKHAFIMRAGDANTNYIFLTQMSIWKNVSPIETMVFSSTSDSIAAGAVLSVYGIL